MFIHFSALKKAKSRLKSLTMYDLKLSGNVAEQNLYLDTILQLEELRHLDVSFGNNDETYFDAVVLNSKLRLSDLMLHYTALPKLVSLDISGIYNNSEIKKHKLKWCRL